MFTNKYLDLTTAIVTLFALMYYGFTNNAINSVLFFAWGIYVFTSSIADYYTKRKLESLREQFLSNLRVIKNEQPGGDDDDAA